MLQLVSNLVEDGYLIVPNHENENTFQTFNVV